MPPRKRKSEEAPGATTKAKSMKPAPSSSHAAGETTSLVPVPKPADAETKGTSNGDAGVSTRLERPELPTGKKALHCEMGKQMKTIVRWCQQELPAAIRKCPGLELQGQKQNFWECRPLDISESNNGSIVGHKEPFDKAKCVTAMGETGMYEASMNIDWLLAFPDRPSAMHIMGDVPTLKDMQTGVASWFDFSLKVDLASTQDQKPRNVFPTVLAAYVDCHKLLERDAFPQNLRLLDGHIFVWAWWLRLYTLLGEIGSSRECEESQANALRMHMDIGYSVSVNVRVETCPAELAKWTMDRGSEKTVAASVVGTDSFAAFVIRCNVFLAGVHDKKRQKALKDANIQYEGKPVYRQMYFPIQASLPLATGPPAAALDRLRRDCGRECFTKGYAKMYLLSRMCTKVSVACNIDTVTLFVDLLQGLWFSLTYSMLQVEDITVGKLTCTRGGNSGTLGVFLWRHLLRKAVFAVVREAVGDKGGSLQVEADALENDFG